VRSNSKVASANTAHALLFCESARKVALGFGAGQARGVVHGEDTGARVDHVTRRG